MSGVAKRSKMLVDSPVAYKPRDTMHISFSKESKKLPDGCKIEQEVVLIVRGKVTGIRADEYGSTLDVEVKSVEKKNA